VATKRNVSKREVNRWIKWLREHGYSGPLVGLKPSFPWVKRLARELRENRIPETCRRDLRTIVSNLARHGRERKQELRVEGETEAPKPVAELELGKRKAFQQFKIGDELLDLAARFQDELSQISAKDWVVWQLPGAPWPAWPPPISPAVLRAHIDRGRPQIRLAVEEEQQFSLLIIRLVAAFPEFNQFTDWKRSLSDFISKCREMSYELWKTAEYMTGLPVSGIDNGDGFLLNVPLFIYEFALDNYMRENLPELEVLPYDAYRYKLIPKALKEFTLAVGSWEQMWACGQSTISGCSRYARDERIGMIRQEQAEIRKQAEPFQKALSQLLVSSPE